MNNYTLIKNIVDDKELNSLDILEEKYNKIIEPGIILKTTKKIENLIPDSVKNLKNELGTNISEKELFIKMMKLVDEGFSKVEEIASKYSINEQQVIRKINKSKNINITKLEDICWLRSYELSNIVNSYKTQDVAIASVEGAGTGLLGFAGLPFNLVLSTFLYFRAVQSIAMFYGYDVKNNPDELALAGEVLKKALNPTEVDSESDDVNLNVISKILIVSKAEVVKQASKKTWTEMASKGGIPLLLTQIRALGHNSAKKALENAGKTGLEHSVFKDVLAQIGKKLPKKAIPKIAVGVGALFSSLIDGKQMNNVLDYADIFYQKRFILEKDYRIKQTKKYKKMLIIRVGIISVVVILILISLLIIMY
jgi:hypothetical protein